MVVVLFPCLRIESHHINVTTRHSNTPLEPSFCSRRASILYVGWISIFPSLAII